MSTRHASRAGSRFSQGALVAFTVLMMLPVILLVDISLRTDGEAARDPLGLPLPLHPGNYVRVFQQMDFLRALGNTLTITGFTVVLVVLFGAAAAWAVVRYTRRWTKAAYAFFVAGLTVPIFVTMTPLYLLMQQLHLLDTYVAVILAYVAMNLPLAVFFFSSFLHSVPGEVEEAAAIDGLGVLRTFWHIVLPLLRPAIATLVLFVGLAVWNDLVVPLLFLTSNSSKTVILSVFSMVGSHSTYTSQLFPAVVLATLPLFVVFVLLQRYVVAGFSAGVGK